LSLKLFEFVFTFWPNKRGAAAAAAAAAAKYCWYTADKCCCCWLFWALFTWPLLAAINWFK
jgi:hypothetical protein